MGTLFAIHDDGSSRLIFATPNPIRHDEAMCEAVRKTLPVPAKVFWVEGEIKISNPDRDVLSVGEQGDLVVIEHPPEPPSAEELARRYREDREERAIQHEMRRAAAERLGITRIVEWETQEIWKLITPQ